MGKVIMLACLLAVAHHVAAQQQTCSNVLTYTENLIPECAQNDVYINWPNYENQQTYYKCNGVGNPVLAECSMGQYFCFVLQRCVGCSQFLPAVQCSQLKTQNKPNCVPIEGGTTTTGTPPTKKTELPTPYYPSTTTTEKTKTTTEKTKTTTEKTKTTNTGNTTTTTTTEKPTTTRKPRPTKKPTEETTVTAKPTIQTESTETTPDPTTETTDANTDVPQPSPKTRKPKVPVTPPNKQ